MTEHKALYENENLLRLARKRVRDKQLLSRHAVFYFLATIFLFCAMNAAYHDDFFEGIFFGIWVGISVLMVNSVVKYFSPHLRVAKKDPVEAEYEKLKRMDYDEIAREFSRM